MLNEEVVLIPTGCELWRRPVAKSDAGCFVSVDGTRSVDEVIGKLPAGLRENSITCVGFAHPLREGIVRVLCFLPDLPSLEALQDLRAAEPKALEIHCNKTGCDTMQRTIASASLDGISVIRSIQSGYIIHGRAHEVMEECWPVLLRGLRKCCWRVLATGGQKGLSSRRKLSTSSGTQRIALRASL
jgi:hypothetical protein